MSEYLLHACCPSSLVHTEQIVTFPHIGWLHAVAALATAACARHTHAVRVILEGCQQARRRALLHAKNIHLRPRAALRHRWDCDQQGAGCWVGYAGRSRFVFGWCRLPKWASWVVPVIISEIYRLMTVVPGYLQLVEYRPSSYGIHEHYGLHIHIFILKPPVFFTLMVIMVDGGCP